MDFKTEYSGITVIDNEGHVNLNVTPGNAALGGYPIIKVNGNQINGSDLGIGKEIKGLRVVYIAVSLEKVVDIKQNVIVSIDITNAHPTSFQFEYPVQNVGDILNIHIYLDIN